ncbi:MAG: nucleotidyltransferase [Alphaproteobacteria bacterium]|nr:MAG: nucleotidyltransferase [Alphaproteobacteria bacterium]
MSVSKRFRTFLDNLKLTDIQKQNGASRKESVVRAMNSHYYNSQSTSANAKYVGSWAKLTRIRPPRDVDVLFNLPASTHTKYEGRSGNKQSQLLQEVRSILLNSFPSTAIKGDGPVVIVPFSSYDVELIPAFSLSTGGHWVCMTDNNGYYKKADYEAENSAISNSNTSSNGNTRDLVRMMKCWQAYCSVPMKSFHIELIAIDFLATWGNSGKSETFYDWMCRDFLEYLLNKQNGYVYAPGTYEMMFLGSAWATKAQTALGRAKNACIHEGNSNWAAAGDEWQKIFGTDIPKYVS